MKRYEIWIIAISVLIIAGYYLNKNLSQQDKSVQTSAIQIKKDDVVRPKVEALPPIVKPKSAPQGDSALDTASASNAKQKPQEAKEQEPTTKDVEVDNAQQQEMIAEMQVEEENTPDETPEEIPQVEVPMLDMQEEAKREKILRDIVKEETVNEDGTINISETRMKNRKW